MFKWLADVFAWLVDVDVFAATKAIAAAAEMSVTAVAIRRDDRTRFERIEILGDFINLAVIYIESTLKFPRSSANVKKYSSDSLQKIVTNLLPTIFGVVRTDARGRAKRRCETAAAK
jgi:hypothetical protein